MGWAVIVVWECQLKRSKREQTLREMEYYINKSYLERLKIKDSKFHLLPENKDYINLVAEEEVAYVKKNKK